MEPKSSMGFWTKYLRLILLSVSKVSMQKPPTKEVLMKDAVEHIVTMLRTQNCHNVKITSP